MSRLVLCEQDFFFFLRVTTAGFKHDGRVPKVRDGPGTPSTAFGQGGRPEARGPYHFNPQQKANQTKSNIDCQIEGDYRVQSQLRTTRNSCVLRIRVSSEHRLKSRRMSNFRDFTVTDPKLMKEFQKRGSGHLSSRDKQSGRGPNT